MCSKRSPDERSEIRGQPRRYPAFRGACHRAGHVGPDPLAPCGLLASLDRGSDRGQPMRILSLALLLFASSASAQSPPSVDCNAVKNSMVPVELAYHSQDGTRTVVQAYRDKSGAYVVC